MRPLLVLLLLAAIAAPARAEVYKCTDADGRKHYRDQPCPTGEQPADYDPEKVSITTTDSSIVREEAFAGLLTREQRVEREVQVQLPAGAGETSIHWGTELPYQEPYPYPVWYGGDRHPHRHRDRGGRHHDPRPPQPLPPSVQGYAPQPPTIREVAPRAPSQRGHVPPRRAGDARDER